MSILERDLEQMVQVLGDAAKLLESQPLGARVARAHLEDKDWLFKRYNVPHRFDLYKDEHLQDRLQKLQSDIRTLRSSLSCRG